MTGQDSSLHPSIAVRELYGRWAHALDFGHPDLVLDDFVEDAVVWVSDRGSYAGMDEIRAITRARAGAVMHVITNVLVDVVDATHARGHAYFHLADLTSGDIVARGRYDDLVVLDGERWKWKVKAVGFLWRSESYAGSVASLRQGGDGAGPNPVGEFGAERARATDS